MARSSFGNVRKLPSGRFQARYTHPTAGPVLGPVTYDTRGDAQAFLAAVRTDIARGTWAPDRAQTLEENLSSAAPTVAAYADDWVAGRTLKPRTRSHYRWLLDTYVVPAFGPVPVAAVTPAAVRAWHAGLETGPTARAHAYSLLRAIMATAVEDELAAANPCRIRGAGKATRDHEVRPATLDELRTLTAAMPERLRLLVTLSAWCALRFGEVTELRRKDVDLKGGVLRVRRGVVRADGEIVVGDPKSAAGKRPVAMPPHILPAVEAHLREHAQPGRDGLLFHGTKTGAQLAHSSLMWHFNRAKHAAGRDDLTPHALRHTGAVLAAQSGATTKELMSRLGHSTSEMAMRYQHAGEERDRVIARRLSDLADGN
jgi:integrase